MLSHIAQEEPPGVRREGVPQRLRTRSVLSTAASATPAYSLAAIKSLTHWLVPWQAQSESVQTQVAGQGSSQTVNLPLLAEARADVPTSGSAPAALTAALREIDALVASAHERGSGEAADLAALTALLRSALADRSVLPGCSLGPRQAMSTLALTALGKAKFCTTSAAADIWSRRLLKPADEPISECQNSC